MQTSSTEGAGVALCCPLMVPGVHTGVAAGSGQLGWAQGKAEGKFAVTGIVGCLECPGLG